MRSFFSFFAFVGLVASSVSAFAADDDIIERTPPKTARVAEEKLKPAAVGQFDLPGRRYALLVGVNDYTYFSDLTYCDDDINNLGRVLQRSGFDPRDTIVLRDGLTDRHLLPFRNNILTQFKNQLDSVQPNDLVLVAFSGHGVHLNGKSYLCASDANLDRAGETMIALDTLYEMLQASPASQKLLIVDACRNDPTPSGTRAPSSIGETNEFTRSLQQQVPPRGTMLLNSCAPNQYSVEDPKFKSGVFMHYVIEGLRGQADADKDSKISLFELYRYAEYETKTYVRQTRNLVQTPVLKGEVTGVYELATVGDPALDPIKLEEPKTETKPAASDVATMTNTAGTKSAGASSAKPETTNSFGLPVDEASQTRALIENHAQLKQGNQYFAAGRYDDAINVFTNVIKVEDNKAVIKEAFKRRSSALLAADPSGNVLKALADSQAAGRRGLTVLIRSSDAKVMDAERVVAQLTSGQSVEIVAANAPWLQVAAVDGNDSFIGWLEMKHLAAPKPQVVLVPQQTQPHFQDFPPQQPKPRPRPIPDNGNGNGNNGGSSRDQIIRGIEKAVIRAILD
jgi:uncharacterized caspase-like protein